MPKIRIKKVVELEKPERLPSSLFVRAAVDTYYAIQELRIKASNRIGAYVKLGMLQEQADGLHDNTDLKMKSVEEWLKRIIEGEVESHPLWDSWLKDVRGIGPCLAGCLVSMIDIKNTPNISKLWRYAGQSVVNGSAERKVRGEKIHYNPVLKTTCWKIGEQFVKQGALYRDLYDQFKKEYRERFPVPVDTGKKNKKGQPIMRYSDGHIHAMAKRKVVKIFLSHLWVKWRQLEGLPVTEPYAMQILGHTGKIEP